jgi:thiamine biosynthesis lipoprotein
MSNPFEISVVGRDEQWAEQKINTAVAEIKRILELLNANDGPVNEINKQAGINPVKVDPEIFGLIKRTLKISDITHGAFDITNTEGTSLAGAANYRNIILDAKKSTVFLKDEGMRINLSPIINGYAADRAKYLLQMQGVSSGVVNAFGSLVTWGLQPDNSPWTIQAADPEQKLQMLPTLNISNMALSTSRNNLNFKAVDTTGRKRGLPWRSIKSVSVLSQSAETAAAMSAPVMIMGTKLGLNLFNKLNQLVCVIVNNRKKVYTSKSISMMLC